MSDEKKLLSIVIPVFREEAHIRESLKVIASYAAKCGIDYELVAVDDGSPDNTWKILQELASEIKELRCIGFVRNFGKEAAIRAGLETARGDGVIVIDSDLQHPPELMPEMVRFWREEGYSVVNAKKAERGRESIINKLGAAVFYSFFNKLTGGHFKGSTDYKLLDREVVECYLSLKEHLMFFRGLIGWFGFKSKDIPFTVAKRTRGSSSWSVKSLFRLAIHAITSFSTLPLQLVTFTGILFSLAALGLGIQTIYNYITGKAESGFTTVILLILIIGSVLMISLGIIGKYISKIYDEIKGRPMYIVAQKGDYREDAGDGA
ncbi:MAG: glycosyltransferase family 2 protein [Spirochaetales bacterium]|nr:glycosyltransferase family 2 protein [Spirochaetales bacterium]